MCVLLHARLLGILIFQMRAEPTNQPSLPTSPSPLLIPHSVQRAIDDAWSQGDMAGGPQTDPPLLLSRPTLVMQVHDVRSFGVCVVWGGCYIHASVGICACTSLCFVFVCVYVAGWECHAILSSTLLIFHQLHRSWSSSAPATSAASWRSKCATYSLYVYPYHPTHLPTNLPPTNHIRTSCAAAWRRR